MNQLKILQILQGSGKKIFTLTDIQNILRIENDQYAYIVANRLVKRDVLERVSKGYFVLVRSNPSDFELANVLHIPSYISLDSALNYYGILIQSPRQIMSVTTNRTKRISVAGKEFTYMHINKKYFIDYQRVDGFLIATPEKALVDAMFFAALGKSSLSFEELILDSIHKNKVKEIAKKISNRAFRKYFNSLKPHL